MYRLVIVAGPNRGSSFNLVEGENSIGRQMDNHIVLTSSKVSKRHCALLASPHEVLFRDESSTNGTFVNGALSRKLALKPGDKIGVGDFVLELVKVGAQAHAHGGASLTPYTGGGMSPSPMTMGSLAMAHAPHSARPEARLSAVPEFKAPEHIVEEPQDLPGKVKFLFENKVMPFFYGMLMKNEYRSMVAIMFGLLSALIVVGSIMPMQDLAEQSIKREALIRARLLSREMSDRFLPNIAGHTESQIDLSLLESEESVKLSLITNPSLQIIAPQSRLNQLLAGGREAVFAIHMSKEFQAGRDKGAGGIIDEHTAIWIEPIRTTDARQIKTQVSALSIVAIDFSGNLIENGGLGVTYAIGFCVAGIASALVYFILMRLAMKPFEALNDDLDQVLRGELPKVTHEFKIEELDGLWDNINATVQRAAKGGGGSELDHSTDAVIWDVELAGVRAMAESDQYGFVAFDSQFLVTSLNPQFEEMSGIRAESIGQSLSQMARDQAFVSLVQDLQDRVGVSPSRSALDEFEFSGVAYQVIAVGVGPSRDAGIAVVFKKKG
jgi:PAS domain-containing protein